MNNQRIFLKTALCCFLLTATAVAWAQDAQPETVNVEFTSEFFPNDPKGLKEIVKVMGKASKAYSKGEYDEALPLLEQAYAYNPDNADVNSMIATIYRTAGQATRATP
jgi:thioredoxin-like negative regulator of GroEL